MKNLFAKGAQVKKTKSDKATLVGGGDLSQLPKQLQAQLKSLYASPDLCDRLTATLFNAIFTEGKATFLMSRRILESVMAKDAHLGRSTLKGGKSDKSELGEFVGFVKAAGWIEVIAEGTALGTTARGYRAAVWTVVDTDMLAQINELHRVNLADQKSQVIKLRESVPTKFSAESPHKDKDKDKDENREQAPSEENTSTVDPVHSENLLTLCRYNLDATDAEIQAEYITAYGEEAYAQATSLPDSSLAVTRIVAEQIVRPGGSKATRANAEFESAKNREAIEEALAARDASVKAYST